MKKIPRSMRAFVLTGHGGLEKLKFHNDWPVPSPNPGEVLVEVGACGMNNTDINTRIAWYSKSVREGTGKSGGTGGFQSITGKAEGWGGTEIRFPRIQGADVAGSVVAAGGGEGQKFIGQRVMIDPWVPDPGDSKNFDKYGYFGSEYDGGFAEYTVARVTNVHPIECNLSDVELASFATSYITAENMLERANVQTGETVLITGGSGGVGSALIQLVRRRGAFPIALCSDDKAEAVKAIGAVVIPSRSPPNLGEALYSASGYRKVDVVADSVGGPIWPQLINCLKRRGRYTCCGAIAGPVVEFDLRTFYLNDLTFTGATIVPPGLFGRLVSYIANGDIKPLVAATYPLEQLTAAQQSFLEKKYTGNIIIDMEHAS